MTKAGESILRGAHQARDYARGEQDGFVAHVPEEVNVKSIRQRLGLSQAKFASQYGFGVDAIRNWEQGRRQPDLAARVLLMVIDKEPDVVRSALTREEPAKSGRAKSSWAARRA